MCKGTTEKKLQTSFPDEHRAKNSQQNSDKPNSRTHQQDQVDFMPGTHIGSTNANQDV